MSIYAVVETGGKQYRVTPGQIVDVDRLGAEPGSSIVLDKVLLMSEDGTVAVGQPHLEGARVLASVVGEGKGEKITAMKYKRKVRYRRKFGHRQIYTRLSITDIISGAEGDAVSRG
mgnify:CR=1 FL=1